MTVYILLLVILMARLTAHCGNDFAKVLKLVRVRDREKIGTDLLCCCCILKTILQWHGFGGVVSSVQLSGAENIWFSNRFCCNR